MRVNAPVDSRGISNSADWRDSSVPRDWRPYGSANFSGGCASSQARSLTNTVCTITSVTTKIDSQRWDGPIIYVDFISWIKNMPLGKLVNIVYGIRRCWKQHSCSINVTAGADKANRGAANNI